MGGAGFATLPEDILRHIAEYYLRHGHGFKQWCKVASAFPGLPDIPLPRVTLSQLAQQHLPWGGIKWALLRQPPASLIEICVQRTRSRAGGLGEEPQNVHIWGGVIQEMKEDCDEDVEATIEMSEDKRGLRALVLKLFPVHEDDGKKLPMERIFKHLQPWVQMGSASLQGLRTSADAISCPALLVKLPLRHLELDIGEHSMARLREIMVALSQCSGLEYLVISAHAASDNLLTQVKLPDLCLHDAADLKHVLFQACFPGGRLCLPPGCQLRLDLIQTHNGFWDYEWRSENGGDLMECIPALCLRFLGCGGELWPSHIQNFTALQYLEMKAPPQLTDLVMLQHIPHVRLELHQDTVLHTAGSWQNLEIRSHHGFEIRFADIDAFVRDNRRYLLEAFFTPKAWRSMRDALKLASIRQGVGYFLEKPGVCERVSSIQEIASSAAHVACVEDFWPKQSMRSCMPPAAPSLRANTSQCNCRLSHTRQSHVSSSPIEDVSQPLIIPGPKPPLLELGPGLSIESGPESCLRAVSHLICTEHAGQLHASPFVASALPILSWPDPPILEPRPVFKPSTSTGCESVIGLNALPSLNYTENVEQLDVSPIVASPIIPVPTPPNMKPKSGPVVKPSVSIGSGPVSSLHALPDLNHRERAGKPTLMGCLTWLSHKLRPTRITMHCVRCSVVEAPGETAQSISDR